MTIKCYVCNGSKEYTPLGGISKKCGACGGLGYNIVVDKPVEKIDKESIPEIGQKKRGRPKQSV